MALRKILILRSEGARLEGRTVLLQRANLGVVT
jgi:hypothetical protein